MNNTCVKRLPAWWWWALGLTATYYACIALFRAWISIPVLDPSTYVTTGCEEESLFAIWKFAQGDAVFSDSSKVPFAQSYFNWLFYFVYGSIAKGLQLFQISAEGWIPFYRLFSFGLAVCAGGLVARIASVRQPAKIIVVMVLAGLHPVYHFSYVTTRPDILALLFEAIAVAILAPSLAAGNLRAGSRQLWIFILCAYFAWSAKHSSIGVPGAACLYFILLREWRLFLSVAAGFSAMVLLSLAVGGELYRYALIYSQSSCGYDPTRIVSVTMSVLVRAPHVMVAILMSVWMWCRHFRGHKQDGVVLYLSVVMACSLGIAALAIGKQGAAANYYIGAVFFGTTMLIRYGVHHGIHEQRFWLLAALAGWISPMAFAPSTWSKLLNTRDEFAYHAAAYDQLRHDLQEVESPVLVLSEGVGYVECVGSLPWIQNRAPHFVLAYTYPFDRANGRVYEFGGVGGMIESGTISTIVMAADKSYMEFDGAGLYRYDLVVSNRFWKILSRQNGKEFVP